MVCAFLFYFIVVARPTVGVKNRVILYTHDTRHTKLPEYEPHRPNWKQQKNKKLENDRQCRKSGPNIN